MKQFLLAALLIGALLAPVAKGFANVYVVIYATNNGKTGHSGIAIDNYQEQVVGEKRDTLPTGRLTYFDLWPASDDFRLGEYSANRAAAYFKLPNQLWPSPITPTSLYDNGIPHREFYPCDALLMLRTSPIMDYRLVAFLDSVIGAAQAFNPRSYNCSDFVRQALLQVIPDLPKAKEFIPFGFSTTPNKLCRTLLARKEITVLKSPGNLINQAFIWARIMKRKPASNLLARN